MLFFWRSQRDFPFGASCNFRFILRPIYRTPIQRLLRLLRTRFIRPRRRSFSKPTSRFASRVFKSPISCTKKAPTKSMLFFWRSWRDLNPRAAHHGNTISNRARYDHFDTTPYRGRCMSFVHRLSYYISFSGFSQYFFKKI